MWIEVEAGESISPRIAFAHGSASCCTQKIQSGVVMGVVRVIRAIVAVVALVAVVSV